ncbi:MULTISPECIES: SprT-like domain-containing protein [unclassified Bradyrhizobium]|uniref:SprT-like domain-containing protein n=1 Tax=unclassified Bradyrhizobium TaxID=2631580 RepID=UPI002916C642|nr:MULTISPECIES: SprT-like domain-containing protein [unclassified Bradyrhizobium]
MSFVSYETKCDDAKAAAVAAAVAAYREHGSERKAAAALGIAKTTLHRLLVLAAQDQDAGLANAVASEPVASAQCGAYPNCTGGCGLGCTREIEPAAPAEINPTTHTYNSLNAAYAFFNAELFAGALPLCLITMQRHKGAYGYFAPERFGSRDGATITDEIALNPAHFAERSIKQTLSTLVHEQAHLWQQHFGEPSRNGYHNKEWAAKMKELGLHPSDTGAPGGKETGQKVSHYIIEGGAYDRAFAKLESRGIGDLYCDRWQESEAAKKTKAKKNASKTAFTCPQCEQKAWAKADARLICGECSDDDARVEMVCASNEEA